MAKLLDDLRYAHRLLTKAPGVTAVAIATLALGIGANTAIFSFADVVLWKPLPLPESGRLMMVMDHLGQDSGWIPTSPGTFLDWGKQNHSFSHLAAWSYASVNLTSAGAHGDEPERLPAMRVSEDFFKVLGLQFTLGRPFSAAEHDPGQDRVAVLTRRLWARRFGSDPLVVGTTVQLDGRDVVVAGVAPDGFEGPAASPELYLPLAFSVQDREVRSSHNLFGIGRLSPGVSRQQAQAEMESIAARLAGQYPASNRGWTVTLIPLHDFHMAGLASQFALLLLGAAGFLILMVCSNVASIQFARATGRFREIAVRTALGASRRRVLRQLLTESLVMSAWGAGLGLVVAIWGIDLLRSLLPPQFAESLAGWGGMRLDWRALAFTAVCGVLSGLLSGLAPAIQSTWTNLSWALKLGERGRGSRGSRRIRNVLAAAQITIALVLLMGAGIMAKGLDGLLRKEENFDPKSVLTLRLNLPAAKYDKAPTVRAFYGELLSRIERLPGVEAAATSTAIPHSGVVESIRSFTTEGARFEPSTGQSICIVQRISPRYFETMRIPLRQGRTFGQQDTVDAPRAGIISRHMAERYFRGESPVGKRLKLGGPNDDVPWITVVGVASDVVYNAYDREPRPAIYLPQEQSVSPSVHVVVRTAGVASAIAPAVQGLVREIDRAQPVYQVKTLETLLAEQVSGLRSVAIMIGIFSALSLLLAAIAVYGVIAWSVTERTHEIGVRMALGAARSDVMRSVIGRGMAVALTGTAVGIALSYVLARALAGLVYGVSATDATTFTAAPLLLIAVALAASYLPAHRATMLDPVRVLRSE